MYVVHTQEIIIPKEARFTLKLKAELHAQFMAEAEAVHRPASQLVREFMRAFVEQQRAAREHDAWLHAEIEQEMREADVPNVKRIPHEEIASAWRQQRTELVKRAGDRAEQA